MNDFYRTPMGRKFYDADLPKLIDVLEKLGKHMEESNQLQEKKFKLEEKLTRLQIKNLNESNESSKLDNLF
jgi:phosphate uptake regulator